MGYNQQDTRENMFAWFQAIANTTEPIYANVGMMATKDKDQRKVSEDASRNMILMNIAQALGLMNYDYFIKRTDFDKLPAEKKSDIIQRGKIYIREDYEDKPLDYLYMIQAKVQKEAGISPTYDQKTHSIFQEFRVWKTNKGLIDK